MHVSQLNTTRGPRLAVLPLEDRNAPSDALSAVLGWGPFPDLRVEPWSDPSARAGSEFQSGSFVRWLPTTDTFATLDALASEDVDSGAAYPVSPPTADTGSSPVSTVGLDNDWWAAVDINTPSRPSLAPQTDLGDTRAATTGTSSVVQGSGADARPTDAGGGASSGSIDSNSFIAAPSASAKPVVASDDTPPTEALQPGEERVVWQGRELTARAGEWLIQLNGLTGTPAEQTAAAQNRVSAAGLTGVTVAKHLGADGLFLVQTSGHTSPAQTVGMMAQIPGYQYTEPNGGGPSGGGAERSGVLVPSRAEQ